MGNVGAMARLDLALDLTLLHTLADTPCVLACMGRSVGNMVGGRVVFRVVVCHVGRTFVPVETELPLCCAASEPV